MLKLKAVEKISGFVPTEIGSNWTELWHEYEAAATPEAKVVKQLDKFVSVYGTNSTDPILYRN